MKKITTILSIFILTSCGWHFSPKKTESGVVVEKQYHAPTIDANGYSLNSDGDVSFHTLTDKEKYIIVFKCDHGVVFSINRSDCFASLEKGDTVDICYQELLNGDNEVKELDFLGANKK